MRDIEPYRAVLGLTPPWTVARVELDVKGPQVVVQVDTGPGPFPPPERGTTSVPYHRKPRRWRVTALRTGAGLGSSAPACLSDESEPGARR